MGQAGLEGIPWTTVAHLLQIGLWYEYFLRGGDGTIGHLDDIDTLGELRGRDLASAHVIDTDDTGTVIQRFL